MPGGTVGIKLSRAQLDSLVDALQAMPASVSRTIVKNDPKIHAMLSIMLDSLGKIHFNCTAADVACQERQIVQGRVLSDLKTDNTRITKENELLKAEVRELKKGFFARLKEGFNSWIVKILLAFIAIGIMMVILDVGKSKVKLLWALWKPKTPS